MVVALGELRDPQKEMILNNIAHILLVLVPRRRRRAAHTPDVLAAVRSQIFGLRPGRHSCLRVLLQGRAPFPTRDHVVLVLVGCLYCRRHGPHARVL